MMSTWRIVPPPATAACACAPSCAKSAERIEGASSIKVALLASTAGRSFGKLAASRFGRQAHGHRAEARRRQKACGVGFDYTRKRSVHDSLKFRRLGTRAYGSDGSARGGWIALGIERRVTHTVAGGEPTLFPSG